MSYEKIIEFASRKSLFYPAAEIYPDSPAGFWDFGPTGHAIRRKIIESWRKEFVEREEMLEIHGSQILPEQVFMGSGHLKSFHDPIIQCIKCKKFERADKILSETLKKHIPEATPLEELNKLMSENKIKCPKCKGDFSNVSYFNMMVESIVGRGEIKTYLRPEACQSIFLNFSRMVKTMRMTLPQGIAQVGGAFRNEISPRQSITRAIEFAQMEAEVFFDPDKMDEVENWDEVKDYKLRILRLKSSKVEEIKAKDLITKKLVPGKLIAYYMARTQEVWHNFGIPLEKIRFREIDKDERAFYSLATFDFEVETSLGWLELIANNYRTDYDLKNHAQASKTRLEYDDNGRKIVPHIWEISAGVDRTLFAVLECAFTEEKERTYLKLNRKVAPFHCAIFPLVNKDKMPETAKKILKDLRSNWMEASYDSGGSIGRRYARADEIGIPFCITVDGESLKDKTVTLRDRDSTKQIRIKIDDLVPTMRKLIFENKELKNFGTLI